MAIDAAQPADVLAGAPTFAADRPRRLRDAGDLWFSGVVQAPFLNAVTGTDRASAGGRLWAGPNILVAGLSWGKTSWSGLTGESVGCKHHHPNPRRPLTTGSTSTNITSETEGHP
jgi:hypothetical protein